MRQFLLGAVVGSALLIAAFCEWVATHDWRDNPLTIEAT